MADSTCLAQEDIMDKGDGSPICNTMFSHFNNIAGLACQADSTVDIVHEEVGITRPVPALPGCNLPYDDPGLPSIKPSCPSTSSPVMDAPSRMVSWWNDVPGRDPSLFGVYDAPSLPAISNKPSRAATPSTGTMFLCTEPNWGGHKETWPWNKNVCKTLTGALYVKPSNNTLSHLENPANDLTAPRVSGPLVLTPESVISIRECSLQYACTTSRESSNKPFLIVRRLVKGTLHILQRTRDRLTFKTLADLIFAPLCAFRICLSTIDLERRSSQRYLGGLGGRHLHILYFY
jgi:hypothetical protein